MGLRGYLKGWGGAAFRELCDLWPQHHAPALRTQRFTHRAPALHFRAL